MGGYRLKGINLKEMFSTLGSEECMDMIDVIIIDDAIRDSETNGSQNKARAILNKEYDRIGTSRDEIPNYVEDTEDGYDFGFDLKPMG